MKRSEFVFVIVTLAVIYVGWVGKSYQEARAFARVTGQEVATWDAMWLQLRVDCREATP